jgi:GABA(A) receptor-associated protein
MYFKNTFTIDQRRTKSKDLMNKYPDRVPIIVEPSLGTKEFIEKNRFLVPADLQFGKFMFEVRKYVDVSSPEQSCYVLVNEKLVPSNAMIGDIYQKNKDNDGFLYVVYCVENVFG